MNTNKILQALASVAIPEEETISIFYDEGDYTWEHFQEIPKDSAVVHLNTIQARKLSEIPKPEKPLECDSILRVAVSVGFVSRVIHGTVDLEDWFKKEREKFLKPIAYKYDLSKVKIKYRQPNCDYFRPLSDSSAYEFRVHVEYIGE